MNDGSLACVFGPTVATVAGSNGGANAGGSSAPSTFGGISTMVSVPAVVIYSTLLQCTAPPALVPGPVSLSITRRGVLVSSTASALASFDYLPLLPFATPNVTGVVSGGGTVVGVALPGSTPIDQPLQCRFGDRRVSATPVAPTLTSSTRSIVCISPVLDDLDDPTPTSPPTTPTIDFTITTTDGETLSTPTTLAPAHPHPQPKPHRTAPPPRAPEMVGRS